MKSSKSAIAILLVFVFASSNVLGFGQTDASPIGHKEAQTPPSHQKSVSHPIKTADDKKPELSRPVAIGEKSRSETEIRRKKFPWLLVGGIVVVGIVAAVLFLKKKKTTSPPNPETAKTGNIQVESMPAGAKIFLNGNDLGMTTNMTIRGIPPGNHTIKLVLAGYNDYEQSVEVQEGQTAEITATLTPRVVQEPVMIRLPGGTFMMGSESDEAFSDERPVHRVTLSGFEIGKYEVTQAEWVSVMGSNPSYFKGARLPVEKLTWPDVQAYIQKLNEMTGKRYRLPTEAEWEYACRAGTTGDRYGDLDSIAWYSGNSGHLTHEVGGKAPNGFGLFDMLGNVYEWCSDCFEPYSPEPVINPKGPQDCDEIIANSHHNVRGGSWLQEAVAARATHRNTHVPGHHYDLLGFRLARD
jgi:formylglycine-generating enzyme required for sulfatase activity